MRCTTSFGRWVPVGAGGCCRSWSVRFVGHEEEGECSTTKLSMAVWQVEVRALLG